MVYQDDPSRWGILSTVHSRERFNDDQGLDWAAPSRLPERNALPPTGTQLTPDRAGRRGPTDDAAGEEASPSSSARVAVPAPTPTGRRCLIGSVLRRDHPIGRDRRRRPPVDGVGPLRRIIIIIPNAPQNVGDATRRHDEEAQEPPPLARPASASTNAPVVGSLECQHPGRCSQAL